MFVLMPIWALRLPAHIEKEIILKYIGFIGSCCMAGKSAFPFPSGMLLLLRWDFEDNCPYVDGLLN